jgi:tight adherence protein C
MVLALSIFVFLTLVVIVFAFGAAAVAPSSVLGSRLREIGWQRPKAQAKPAIRERMQQALDPLSRALPLSPADVSQTRLWLIQAGYRSPQHVTIYRGLRVLFAALGFISVFLFTGFESPLLLLGLTGVRLFHPAFPAEKEIAGKAAPHSPRLPDGLDLTVICVEAGLSLDQAMMRVGEDLRTAHPGTERRIPSLRPGNSRRKAARRGAPQSGRAHRRR